MPSYPKFQRHAQILDTLHDVPMPLYDAVQLHDAIDEICDRDTYMEIHQDGGAIFHAAQVKYNDDRDFVTVILNYDPKVAEIEDLIYTKTLPHPEGVYISLHAQVNLKVSTIRHATLRRS